LAKAQELKMIKAEIYMKQESYNPRLRATIPGAWICDTDSGWFAICPDYAASSAQEALAILNARGEQYAI
jgi:hypothetical protein